MVVFFMDAAYVSSQDGFDQNGMESPLSVVGDPKRTNALSTKIVTVLSTSYTDSETREGLRLLDARGSHHDGEVERNLKEEAQKEVIDSNSGIIAEFGEVAEVTNCVQPVSLATDIDSAIVESWYLDCQPQQDLR